MDQTREESTNAALVPVGLEELLGMAAVDAGLEEALLADPLGTAQSLGVALEPTELAILSATGRARLGGMIAGLRQGLGRAERREFLGRAALATAVLLGAGALQACSDKNTANKARSITEPPPSPPVIRRRPRPRDYRTAPTGVRPDFPWPPRRRQRDGGVGMSGATGKPGRSSGKPGSR